MRPGNKENRLVLLNLLFLGTIYVQITLRDALMSTETPYFLDSKSTMKSKTTFSARSLYVGLSAVHLPCLENFHKM